VCLSGRATLSGRCQIQNAHTLPISLKTQYLDTNEGGQRLLGRISMRTQHLAKGRTRGVIAAGTHHVSNGLIIAGSGGDTARNPALWPPDLARVARGSKGRVAGSLRHKQPTCVIRDWMSGGLLLGLAFGSLRRFSLSSVLTGRAEFSSRTFTKHRKCE
jgi:hypothetical protein